MSQQCHHPFGVSQTVSDLPPTAKRPSNGLRKRGDPLKVTKQPATMKRHILLHQNHSQVELTHGIVTQSVHTQQQVTPTVTAPQATSDALTHGKGRLGVVWPEAGHPTWRRTATKLPCDIAAVEGSTQSQQQLHTHPVSLQPTAIVSPRLTQGSYGKTAHGWWEGCSV